MSDAPELARARAYIEARAWDRAFRAFEVADRATPLAAVDLERHALAAYLTGRDDVYLAALERAYHAYLGTDDPRAAARCAFWIGFRLAMRGEHGRATGWLGRARRLLPDDDGGAIAGYLLLPVAEGQLASGDTAVAYASAAEAVEIGERHHDLDLIACARHLQGRARLVEARVAEGLALLDEVMVGALAGELSPVVTGLLYCSVIDGCTQVYALGRACEWTAALSRWCDEQPEMVAFGGACAVHRAEILQMRGQWTDALAEARRVEASAGSSRGTVGAARYRQAELHRLRGDLAAAAAAYRAASESAWEPQPGLALLRLAEGRADVAANMIRRAASATASERERIRLLPALVEITLAVGEHDEARAASAELTGLAERFDADALHAIAAYARGLVGIATDDPAGALASLRHAWRTWERLDIPFEAARARAQIAHACRAIGDADGARLELEAARRVFEQLGAQAVPAAPHAHRLTARELEVLRLVASGLTNRAIGKRLFVSEKTIDRHVSNILAKLEVSSRTAAAAFAYEHGLVAAG